MSNPFYGPSGSPGNQSRGSSAQVRAEFGLIEAGFSAVNTAILGIQTSAINAILPSQAGNPGRILSTNGTAVSWIDNIPAVAAYASNSGQLGGVAANGYALLSGATFTGATNVVNVAAGNNTTLAANTAFVTAAVAQAKADIVSSSPAALDTLNEFAIALGNDANFSTTTATALGSRLRVDTAAQGLNSTQKSNAATNLGLAAVATSGLKADVGLGNVDNTSDANKPASIAQAAINAARVTGVTATAPVVSSGGMAPVISMPAATAGANGYLTAADWNIFSGKQAALGFTPYNSTNPAGYITGINSSQVTTALGYTPYNASNPSGFISGITSGQVTTALGFTPQQALGFTPYNAANPSGYINGINSGNVTTALGYTPANAAGQVFTGNVSAPTFTATSDERKKTNWRPLTDGQLDTLANMQLAGFFDWKDGSGASLGGSAQEIARIVPEAVHEDEEGNLTVNYGGLCFAMQQATLRRLWGVK